MVKTLELSVAMIALLGCFCSADTLILEGRDEPQWNLRECNETHHFF